MRKGVLIIGLTAVMLAILAVDYWSPRTIRDPFPRSAALVVTVVARTNATVLLAVSNEGGQSFEMQDSVIIEYSNPESPDDYYPGSVHRFTNDSFAFAPGARLEICLPVPTNHLNWRAHVGGYGQRQIDLKNAIYHRLKHSRLRRLVPPVYPEYAGTDWFYETTPNR